MTRFESEIKKAFEISEMGMTCDSFEKWSGVAAEVAKKYIANAFGEGFSQAVGRANGTLKTTPHIIAYYENWLKENGIK